MQLEMTEDLLYSLSHPVAKDKNLKLVLPLINSYQIKRDLLEQKT